MKMTLSLLKEVASKMQKTIMNNRISNITVLNTHDLLLSFSMYRAEKLLLSLNHQAPFVSFVKTNQPFVTTPGVLNETLRKEIKDAVITNIEIINNDRILAISLQKSNEIFEKEEKHLIFELVPTKANLLLLDGNQAILFALHYASLDKPRPLLKGMTYECVTKSETFKEDSQFVDLDQYQQDSEAFLLDSLEVHHHERYESLFRFIKNRIKSLQKKEIILDKEMQEAQRKYIYAEYGNTLLSLVNDPASLDTFLKENNLQIDEKISLGGNANKFFKIYKKAKRTVEMDKAEIIKARIEKEKLEVTLSQARFMNDEELLELSIALMPYKFKDKKIKINQKSMSYVLYHNTKIFFGKNARENDELTFKKSHPQDWFFHIKDYHGSHVVINNDHPDNDTILVAAEMCLILSNQETGEVQYCPIRQVKKGQENGQALLPSYQSIILHEVREESKQLLSHYQN